MTSEKGKKIKEGRKTGDHVDLENLQATQPATIKVW